MTVQEWLGTENQLGQDIWERKYRYENETFDEWINRVSGGNSEIANLIKEKKFLFGGRILANRGLENKGRKINVPNDFTVEQVEGLYMTAWDAGLKGVTTEDDKTEGTRNGGFGSTDK